MGKHYDQLLKEAADLFPSRIKIMQAMIAEGHSIPGARIRLQKREMEQACLRSATEAVQMDLNGAIQAIAERPEILKARIDGAPGSLATAVTYALGHALKQDMEAKIEQSYHAEYEGLGRDDLIRLCMDAVEALAHARRKGHDYDMAKFDERLSEVENDSHPQALLRLGNVIQEVTAALEDSGNLWLARRLLELVDYAALNQEKFQPEASPRP